MIPYTVGKLAPNSSHLTRGLVKYVPGRDYFRAVSSQNGDKFVTSPPPPPIVERVSSCGKIKKMNASNPSEHRPNQGGELSKRLGGDILIGCKKDKNIDGI